LDISTTEAQRRTETRRKIQTEQKLPVRSRSSHRSNSSAFCDKLRALFQNESHEQSLMAEQSSRPQPAGAVNPEPARPATRRIDSIDLLRGIVMVIMMLDHVRDFVHSSAVHGIDPTDLATTTPALFFTRWITHFCAPLFVFLAGTGAYLQFARGKSKRELSKFLLTRGLWLIVLEFTLIRCLVVLNFDYTFLGVMQVFWVLGVSMIVLAGLIYLPLRVVGAFG